MNSPATTTTTLPARAPAADLGRAPLAPPRPLGSGPLHRLLHRLVAGIGHGSIAMVLPDGRRVEARAPQPGPHAVLVLHRWHALWRLAWQGDIGLAEAYRDGDWSTPDLTAVLEFGALNEAGWSGTVQASWPARLAARLVHLARANTRRGSRRNISAHYDLGNDFYAKWLDADLIYSSALYRAGADTLEQAQAAKIRRIVELLQVESMAPGAEVLEIGCGWGALALQIARQTGARVTGLTLSTQQLEHARRRVASEGAGARVELRLQDYRDVQGGFDRIVSIEMLEAVGERYWPRYFETVRQRLRPEGVAVVQAITIAESHFEGYRREADFIQRHIFPGGMLPTVEAMRREAARAGLRFEVAESFGASYARTLADWRQRFLHAWPGIAAQGFDDRFRRLWEYYLCYCEAGFRTGRVDVGLYVLRPA